MPLRGSIHALIVSRIIRARAGWWHMVNSDVTVSANFSDSIDHPGHACIRMHALGIKQFERYLRDSSNDILTN